MQSKEHMTDPSGRSPCPDSPSLHIATTSLDLGPSDQARAVFFSSCVSNMIAKERKTVEMGVCWQGSGGHRKQGNAFHAPHLLTQSAPVPSRSDYRSCWED